MFQVHKARRENDYLIFSSNPPQSYVYILLLEEKVSSFYPILSCPLLILRTSVGTMYFFISFCSGS